jgi:oligopeptide transport system substrate-binding protein
MPQDSGEPAAGRCRPSDAVYRRAVYSTGERGDPRWNKFLQGYYDNSGISSDSFDQAVQFDGGGEAALTESMQDQGHAPDHRGRDLGLLHRVQHARSGRRRRQRACALLRQAIAIAVDFEEFISIFPTVAAQAGPGADCHPGSSAIVPARGINPVTSHLGATVARRRRSKRPERCCAEAGYPMAVIPRPAAADPLLRHAGDAGPDSKAMLQWYRKQLAKLGIELVIRATDYNRFPGQDAQRDGADLQLGLERGLPGSREFPLPAVRTQRQG